jgi:hypothetical protein
LNLKREEVAGGWRILHNELHNLYASSNIIIRVTKSRRVRWAGYVARVGEMRNAYDILVGKPERKRPRGRWGIILECILEKEDGKMWTGCIWIRIGTIGRLSSTW